MDFSGYLPRRAVSVSVVILSAVGLSGCFDLEQKVGLHSNGSGTYAMAISAKGLLGDALDRHDADIDISDDDDSAITRKTRKGDVTTQTSEIAFHDLSDLRLGDETVALHVKGKTDGATEVNFHRTFHVDEARHHHDDDDHLGKDVLQTMFDGDVYKFSVWLPGRIEHIAPVRVAGQVVHPTVWGDRYGHTISWKMPLSDAFLANQIDFDVDFAAQGAFKDTRSSPGRHHVHHRRHRSDDDDDDDDNDHT